MSKIYFAIVQCPYCNKENQVNIDEWERPKCEECGGVYHVSLITDVKVTPLSNQGEMAEKTIVGYSNNKFI